MRLVDCSFILFSANPHKHLIYHNVAANAAVGSFLFRFYHNIAANAACGLLINSYFR